MFRQKDPKPFAPGRGLSGACAPVPVVWAAELASLRQSSPSYRICGTGAQPRPQARRYGAMRWRGFFVLVCHSRHPSSGIQCLSLFFPSPHHSPLEGESARPRRQPAGEPVGGEKRVERRESFGEEAPHRLSRRLTARLLRLPLKGGVMGCRGWPLCRSARERRAWRRQSSASAAIWRNFS